LSSIFFTALYITLAAATPAPKAQIISIPITTHIKEGTTAAHILASDRARRIRKEKRQTTSPATNDQGVQYLAPVKFGGSSTTYNLVVDTGSSNTWVGGAGQSFTCKSPCKSNGGSFEVEYGSGSVTGTGALDSVTIGSITIQNQQIGVGKSSQEFEGTDGLLGLGPEDLTEGTFSSVSEAPTVIQNAYSQGLIPLQLLGVSFAPCSSTDCTNGELDLGGIDTSKTTSSVSYASVGGAGADYWGISTAITIGSTSAGTSGGIVDTGTTLVYLPSSAYNTWIKAIPSATVDNNSGLVRFPKSSLSSVPSISFTVGGTKFTLNNYAQLVEQGLYSSFGLSSTYYYSWISNGGSSGLDFIIGQKFLERFYSVYDTTNNRVGFATTSNSNPTSAP